MKCCYLVGDVDDQFSCGEESVSTYLRLPLCSDHDEHMKDILRRRCRTTALQSAKYHPMDTFPGLCYLVLLPDGFVKIGYSNTQELLDNRFKSLSRDYEAPVIPLAVIKGGFVAEAVLHEKFDSYREPGVGERFRYSPELAEYIASVR